MPIEGGGVALRRLGELFGRGTAAGLSDGHLLARFADRHDETAFATLVERHGPMVMGVCRRVLRDRHEAEDAFQASFLVLARKAGSIRVDDSAGRWLYTVARRIALRAAAESSRRGLVDLVDRAGAVADDELEGREIRAALDEELGRLPESYRAPVVLCHLEGLSHEEAARRLRWPVGTVKGRLVRARGLLRTRLARRGIGAPAGGALLASARPEAVSAATAEATVKAALGFAAIRAASTGAFPAAASLAKGVLDQMFLSKIRWVATAFLTLGIGAGLTAARADRDGDEPARRPVSNVALPPGAPEVAEPQRRLGPDARQVDRDANRGNPFREQINRLDQRTDDLRKMIEFREQINRLDQKAAELRKTIDQKQQQFEEDQRQKEQRASEVQNRLDAGEQQLRDLKREKEEQAAEIRHSLDLTQQQLRDYQRQKPDIADEHRKEIGQAQEQLRDLSRQKSEAEAMLRRIDREPKPAEVHPRPADRAGAPPAVGPLPRRPVVGLVPPPSPSFVGQKPRVAASEPPGRFFLVNGEARPATEGRTRSLPNYIVEPPDIIIVEVLEALPGRPITGERLVRPDGKISLGFYGDVYVAGLTTDQIKEKVVAHLRQFLPDEALGLVTRGGEGGRKAIEAGRSTRVFVDVTSYNSKVYYVQGDVASPGRLPVTGSETVLDAINYAGGLLPAARDAKVRLVRPAPKGTDNEQVLPVDLDAIVQKADPTTNYQILPGDRIIVERATPPPTPATDPARREAIESRIDVLIRELEALKREVGKPG